MDTQQIDRSKEQMEIGIKRWQVGLIALGLFLIAAYSIFFGMVLGQMPARDAEKWGQFGDFVGGLLNPVVAFAAFYWLTQSVKIQQTELAETRKALQGAEAAQKIQAINSEQNLRFASRAALVSALQSQISAREDEVREYENRVAEVIELLSFNNSRVKKYLEDKRSVIGKVDPPIDVEIAIAFKTKYLEEQKDLAIADKQKLIQERDNRLNELRNIVDGT
ncbi:hypothetical protein ACLS0R_19280 [Comamonas jiangduensis]|uniref:hypothetical protein n=1 Tax=Comamonas jiangduensis TaxID=1194168 RepID=UPI003BF7EEDC